jgi:multidrug transporter EmrE-like cation transporter
LQNDHRNHLIVVLHGELLSYLGFFVLRTCDAGMAPSTFAQTLSEMGLAPLYGGVLLSLIEGVGSYSLKRFAVGGASMFLSFGMAVYLALAGVLTWLMKSNGLALVNAYWDGTSNLLTMLMGSFIFNEKYTVRQWIGMGTIALGILIIDSGTATSN